METNTYAQAFTDKIALLNIIERRGIACICVEFVAQCYDNIIVVNDIIVRDIHNLNVDLRTGNLDTLIEDVVVTELKREDLDWIGDHGGWGVWEYNSARGGRSATFECRTHQNRIESSQYEDTSFMPTNWLSLHDEESTSIYQRTAEGSEFIGNLIDTQCSDPDNPRNARNAPRKDDFL